jgi:hypothetical protein
MSAMLQVDHINNDGSKERKKIGKADDLYRYLINNNFPEGYRILCGTCNMEEYWNFYKSIHPRDQIIKVKNENIKYKENVYNIRYAKMRLKILNAYSNNNIKCACCGELFIPMLTIDHINNDGWGHRKKVGRGKRFYQWLITNKFPPGFQVLCFVCNTKKYWDFHKYKNKGGIN